MSGKCQGKMTFWNVREFYDMSGKIKILKKMSGKTDICQGKMKYKINQKQKSYKCFYLIMFITFWNAIGFESWNMENLSTTTASCVVLHWKIDYFVKVSESTGPDTCHFIGNTILAKPGN